MAEGEETDKDQKTEEPTARRLEEARERGQTIQSREINNWMILFVATLLAAIAPAIFSGLKDLLAQVLARSGEMDISMFRQFLPDFFASVASYVLLPLVILSLIGAVAAFIQIGPLFTLDPLEPDLSRISPLAGVKRLFSVRSIVELLKGILKISLIGTAGYVALRPYFDSLDHFALQELSQSLSDFQGLFIKMMIAGLSILFLLAILDYLYQRHEFMQQMRMSREELREEYKQTEGDPHIKSRLRQLREEKARQRMMQAVPDADVVITNPTHFAVALKYKPEEHAAPVMIAKGADAVAERIKEVARENNIPILENAPLTRALYSSIDIDESIPEEHYKAVAEVISYVFKLKNRKI